MGVLAAPEARRLQPAAPRWRCGYTAGWGYFPKAWEPMGGGGGLCAVEQWWVDMLRVQLKPAASTPAKRRWRRQHRADVCGAFAEWRRVRARLSHMTVGCLSSPAPLPLSDAGVLAAMGEYLGMLLARTWDQAAAATCMHAAMRQWERFSLSHVGRLYIANQAMASIVYYHTQFVRPAAAQLEEVDGLIASLVARPPHGSTGVSTVGLHAAPTVCRRQLTAPRWQPGYRRPPHAALPLFPSAPLPRRATVARPVLDPSSPGCLQTNTDSQPVCLLGVGWPRRCAKFCWCWRHTRAALFDHSPSARAIGVVDCCSQCRYSRCCCCGCSGNIAPF